MQTIGAFEAKSHLGLFQAHAKETIEKIKNFQLRHSIELALDWKMLRDEGRK